MESIELKHTVEAEGRVCIKGMWQEGGRDELEVKPSNTAE